MRIHAAGLSNAGHRREKNDDFYCIGPFVEQETLTALSLDSASGVFQQYGFLAAVADGMGAYAGGAVASRVVLETLSALFYGERHAGMTEHAFLACLEGYLAKTKDVLTGVLQRSPELREAGTTLAGIALLAPDILAVFHIGDSRVLRASAGYVRPLTVDHTPIGQDIASGRLTEVEAARIPGASSLTRSLGLQGNTTIECVVAHTAVPGNQFFIGTDAWHGVGRGLSRQTIQDIARQGDRRTR